MLECSGDLKLKHMHDSLKKAYKIVQAVSKIDFDLRNRWEVCLNEPQNNTVFAAEVEMSNYMAVVRGNVVTSQ